jgi:hypothetical protein
MCTIHSCNLIIVVLRSYISKSMAFYLDDIFIFNNNREEHMKHLRWVFEALRNGQLRVILKKCEFFKERLCIFVLWFLMTDNRWM